MTQKPRHVAIGYNTSHYVWMLRANLVRAFIAAGHRVTIIAPRDKYTPKLEAMGAHHVHVPMLMNRNPFSDLQLMYRLKAALRQVQPDIYLGYTAKPNIYGSMAAHSLNIPVVNNIAGLGVGFAEAGMMARIMKVLYRLSLRKSALVFFQNTDDVTLFRDHNILTNQANIDVLPGSGVDLTSFQSTSANPDTGNAPLFLFIARLLWAKGVAEFVDAAHMTRKHFPNTQFEMMGSIDNNNPAAVPRSQVDTWNKEGVVRHLGFVEDVRGKMAEADCVVLPSYYREGTPRSLLEAGAMARPIITTDSVGCRDTVDDGISGFICTPRSAEDLADKMIRFCEMSFDERAAMGQAGRAKMVNTFDETIVIDKYLEAISTLSRA
ncbi:N, N'-diacetylbacillosaminyl-diphospho-undecaprenol alpha-1,3-N-acetylgalactosaminyltransferase [Roseovarius albus]|uniref:N, N'-diacetylbacillosaminyl-diphospho-undecaprenol alpha-1,3-N-acetylgalactosaminyltransferase n=1 Tax=Roseovarius albus TaxID=1247867 RepID=A0A1X6ZTB0_9RHOB|nr:glycosyltransferase family 4 protein [Roseovarius albus]SLN59038.1 N, N'-diacetylbacillosaminyl-diphospho-undecaprenol alpha-1,3-N-acetylgalactosaminyltransferase [Roseovarius albus]